MNQDIIELGKSQYRSAYSADQYRRNEQGFIVLTPTASRVDEKVDSLTTDISSLESKLKRYREEKARAEKYRKSDEYKESKKSEKEKKKEKKKKKERNELLEMVFNNADRMNQEEMESEEEEGYRDNKKPGSKKKTDTLDTTYGKRFSPVVSMLYDSINEFDKIASDISKELDTPQLRAKTMYRSTQIGNMISARNSKLSAVKELASVATTISNLEYKKEKDRKAEEGADSSKAISALGAKFLRGGLDDSSERKAGKKGKKGSSGKKFDRYTGYDEDDDDSGKISKASDKESRDSDAEDRELASELAKALGKHKDITFTAHERYMSMDGTYTIMVECDPVNAEKTAKFVAVDKKGKIIPNFKDDYPGLLPKRKACKFVFDIGRKRVTDKNSGRSYKLLFTD